MARRAKAPGSVRAQLLDALRRYPGLHVRGLERMLGVSAQLAQYHLRKLVEEGFIEAHEQGGYLRYYPTAKLREVALHAEDVPLLGLLREEVPLHVVLLLLDQGPQPHGRLVESLGVAKSTVSYHLAKLADAGIIDRVPGSPDLRLVDRERVYRLLLANEPTPDLLDAFADLWGDLYG